MLTTRSEGKIDNGSPPTAARGNLRKWLRTRWPAPQSKASPEPAGGLLWPRRGSVSGKGASTTTASVAPAAQGGAKKGSTGGGQTARRAASLGTRSDRRRRRRSSVERVAYRWKITYDDARELCDNVENPHCEEEEEDTETPDAYNASAVVTTAAAQTPSQEPPSPFERPQCPLPRRESASVDLAAAATAIERAAAVANVAAAAAAAGADHEGAVPPSPLERPTAPLPRRDTPTVCVVTIGHTGGHAWPRQQESSLMGGAWRNCTSSNNTKSPVMIEI